MELSPFVTVSIPYATAFLAGLFGGVHCIGMCGGVSGAMVFSIPESQRARSGILPFILSYNLGRIITYSLLGALIGLVGAQGGDVISHYGGWMWLRILAGVLMILMGLYLASWWNALILLERLGDTIIWQRLRPLGQRLMPVTNPLQALRFGLVWGLLPCGLVYTMLVWSLASGGWMQGGAFLFSFGLGTLPVMLLVGAMAGQVGQYFSKAIWRQAAGVMVILFGLWTIISTLTGHINVGLGCIPG